MRARAIAFASLLLCSQGTLAAADLPQPASAQAKPPSPQKVFEIASSSGPKAAYRVPGKSAFFYRSGLEVDYDGAPNAYHPLGRYDAVRNPNGKGLDANANAGSPG